MVVQQDCLAKNSIETHKSTPLSNYQLWYHVAMKAFEFKCNLCNYLSNSEWDRLLRDGPSCDSCGSSIRMREIVCAFLDLYSVELSRDFKVVGLSDADLIADYFRKLIHHNYTNTFFDTHPKLDICNLQKDSFETADVLISSDVFEHVFFPLSNALEGSFNLLKPGGTLICTMPWTTWQSSIEHFPWMTSYSVHEQLNGDHVVLGVDSTGSKRRVENPIFHGGPGNTLEMRKINVFVLVEDLKRVGFTDIKIHHQDRPEFGIRRPDGVVGVVTAIKPKVQMYAEAVEQNNLVGSIKRLVKSRK